MPVPALLADVIAAFLPLFVAINIPGILPLYIGMTEQFTPAERQTLLVRALFAALALAVLMLFAGNVIFNSLGITVDDLRVGGGLILLTISITDLAFGDVVKKRRGGRPSDRRRYEEAAEAAHAPELHAPVDLPIVPLGIPLIIGPGAITTILIAEGQFGAPVTLGTIALNLALVFVAFTFGPRLMRVFGPDTSKAVAKVASLFLAAIAVAMIRAGIVGMVMSLQNP
jgi:multiple antibiotic resistance protein